MRTFMVVLVLASLAACSGDDDDGDEARGDELVEAFENAEPCPAVGETISEDFDGCIHDGTLLTYQSYDCTDGRRLIYMSDVGHGFAGEELREGEWPQETIAECTD